MGRRRKSISAVRTRAARPGLFLSEQWDILIILRLREPRRYREFTLRRFSLGKSTWLQSLRQRRISPVKVRRQARHSREIYLRERRQRFSACSRCSRGDWHQRGPNRRRMGKTASQNTPHVSPGSVARDFVRGCVPHKNARQSAQSLGPRGSRPFLTIGCPRASRDHDGDLVRSLCMPERVQRSEQVPFCVARGGIHDHQRYLRLQPCPCFLEIVCALAALPHVHREHL